MFPETLFLFFFVTMKFLLGRSVFVPLGGYESYVVILVLWNDQPDTSGGSLERNVVGVGTTRQQGCFVFSEIA